MRTRKLYDEDAECFAFTATVIQCRRRAEEEFAIELDATAFFPEAGGQSADRGILQAVSDEHVVCSVKDVQIDEEGCIWHICTLSGASSNQADAPTDPDRPLISAADPSNRAVAPTDPNRPHVSAADPSNRADTPADPDPLLLPGTVLRGRIDSERRLEFMRHHTGEHLFSGLVKRDFGYANVGFHLSDHICTMDYDGPISREDLRRLAAEANTLIQKNLRIRAWYPDDAELEERDYRCKGELVPPIRLVEIEGADLCACCAPHVKRTGEIGLLYIAEAASYKGGIRIVLLCGMKAFRELDRRSLLLEEAASLLSARDEGLPSRVQGLLEERHMLRQKNTALNQQLLQSQAASLPTDGAPALLFVEEADDTAVRTCVNSLMETRDSRCGVFTGNDTEGYRFIMGSRLQDMKKTADTLRRELGAKCGGSERMIQGRVTAERDTLERVIRALN